MIEGFDTGDIQDVHDAVASLIKDLPGFDELADAPEFDADTIDVPVDAVGGVPEAADLPLLEQLEIPADPDVPDPFLDELAEPTGSFDLPRALTLPNPFRAEP